MITIITNYSYSIATTSSTYSLANEETIQRIADALGVPVHIGVGEGNLQTYNASTTVPIAGTPFLDIGNYYVTILHKTTSSYYKYLCVYNKSYSQLLFESLYSSTTSLVIGNMSDTIKTIGFNNANTSHAVFCTYTDLEGNTTPCFFIKLPQDYHVKLFHTSTSYSDVYMPNCAQSATSDYACIVPFIYGQKCAYFDNIYLATNQPNSSTKTVLLNGVVYEVLCSYNTAYPGLYFKVS